MLSEVVNCSIRPTQNVSETSDITKKLETANNSPIIHVVTIKILARFGNMYCWYCNPYRMKRNLSIATNSTDKTDTSVDETIIPATRRKNELNDVVVRHTSQLILDCSSDQLQLTLELNGLSREKQKKTFKTFTVHKFRRMGIVSEPENGICVINFRKLPGDLFRLGRRYFLENCRVH